MLALRALLLTLLFVQTPFLQSAPHSPSPSALMLPEGVFPAYSLIQFPSLLTHYTRSAQPSSGKSRAAGFSLAPSSWILMGIGVGILFSSGSSGGSDTGSDDVTEPLLPVVPRGIEYHADYAHAMMGTRAAHEGGWVGTGVNIALLDTGFMTTHSDLVGQFSSLYNAVTDMSGAEQVPDLDGHGTGVAGLLASVQDGAGVVGVAHGARLIGVGFAEANGQLSQSDTVAARAFNYALDQQAEVINNSWGTAIAIDRYTGARYASESPLLLTALRRATSQGVVNVFPTGNNAPALNQPNLEAGLPRLFPELQAHWVAVTAVGSDGVIASYAQRCGLASAWCIAAPGGDNDQGVFEGLITPFKDGGYVSTIGTSEAAPLVSGALAVLKQRFPTLTNAQLVERLFETADKRGIYSETLVYGQGLLNIDAATNPLGALSLVTQGVDERAYVVAELAKSRIQLAPSLSRLGTAFSGLRLGAVDSQGALFTVAMQDLMAPPSGSEHWRQRLKTQHQPYRTVPVSVGHDTRIWLSGHQKDDQAGGLHVEHRLGNVEVQLGLTQGVSGVEQYTASAWNDHSGLRSPFALQDTLSNPYQLTDGRQIHLRVVQEPGVMHRVGFELASGHDDDSGQFQINSFWDYQLTQNLALRLEGGVKQEKGALLGSRFDGAFKADTTLATGYTGATVRWQMGSDDQFQASYFSGHTESSNASGSSLLYLDNLSSRSLAAAWQHKLTRGAVFGVAIAEPLQIRAGEWTLNTATGYEEGKILWQTRHGELGHSRLQEQEIFIRSPENAEGQVTLSLLHQRVQKNSDVALLMSLWQRF